MDVVLVDGSHGRAIVLRVLPPQYEVLELRDGDKKRYGGKGVFDAVEHVNDEIVDELIG